VLRLVIGIAAGIMALFLVGAGAASGRLSGGPNVANQTTTLHFSVSAKANRRIGKGRELARVSGSGTLTLAETPQQGPIYNSTSATGTITVHHWRVVGGRVIDEDDISMDVLSGLYHFASAKDTSTELHGTVSTASPKQKAACPVGSKYTVGLLDGHVKAQPDSVGIERCDGGRLLLGGVSGVRAVVKVKFTLSTP
jgi:hypothetical protein